MPPSADDAKRAGREALSGLRGTLAQRIAGLLRRDTELLSEMVELGLVRREWLEDPAREQMSTATPMEVVERWLERSVEQRPSLLGKLGLSAIQQLSASSDSDEAAGVPTRLAVAFTDLEGFTAYTAQEGDEAASELLAVHYRQVGPVVRSRGGHINKRLGDGLLLTFPSAEAGVLACLELVEGEPEPLRLRAGVHFGDVVAAGDEIVGHTVNVAARVAESAKGGEVVVTEEVLDECADLKSVRFSRSRSKTFKGVGEKVKVARAARASSG